MGWDGVEKRKFKRGDVYCRIYILMPQESILSAYTENISDRGLKVVLDRRLSVDSEVDLEIFLEEDPLTCKGRVIWVKPVEGKNKSLYETGVEFLLPT